MEACGLVELPKQRSKSTWNDRGDVQVFSKIDWVFTNNEWVTKMLAYCAHFLLEGVNDHNPIEVSLLDGPSRIRPAFKFLQCVGMPSIILGHCRRRMEA